MKINWKKSYTIAILIVDAILIALFFFLIDVIKCIESSFWIAIITNFLIGILTIMGGFGIAYHIIERDRIRKERQRRERIKQTLLNIKSMLLPWLYDYAFRLSSGYEPIKKFSYIITIGYPPSNTQFSEDKPLFEDVFGSIVCAPQGHNLTETGAEFRQIDSYTIDTQYLLSVLLAYKTDKMLRNIRYEISETPDFRDYVSPDTAKIKHLDDLIEERRKELESWERDNRKSQISASSDNLAIRHNLRALGAKIFSILLSIDDDISNLN